MEDHRGELVLSDREQGGARVQLVFAAEGHVAGRPGSIAMPAELSSVGHGA
jgi:hypothetical protein